MAWQPTDRLNHPAFTPRCLSGKSPTHEEAFEIVTAPDLWREVQRRCVLRRLGNSAVRAAKHPSKDLPRANPVLSLLLQIARSIEGGSASCNEFVFDSLRINSEPEQLKQGGSNRLPLPETELALH
jgi:hypothetical protein